MVRNTSMKEIIISLQDNYKDIIRTRLEYNSAVKANKKSFIQKYQVHLKNLLKKRNFLLNLFRGKIQGNVIRIRYKYQTKDTKKYKEDEALLVNLTKEEAKEVLTLGFSLKGYNIEILEIIEILTFLSKGKL